MNSKELMMNVLNGKVSDRIPVTPHWWGLYKFQFNGLINGYENESLAWSQNYKSINSADKLFYEAFKPDMFHLTTAPNQNVIDKYRIEASEKLRAREDFLSDKKVIEEYIESIWATSEDVERSMEFEHVALCAAEYGDKVFIAQNEGSDVACFFDYHVGFERGLIAILEEPENVAYFLSRLYERTFERIKVLKKKGAHAFINSETYCSADIMSPNTYRDVILPIHKEFYHKLQKIDIIPIVYFTGNLIPNIQDIKKTGAKGLMIEAPKKGMNIDVADVIRGLDGEIALFGNLDSHGCLELGTVADVISETKKQLEKTKGMPFIMANDCPISFNTPQENIKAMIETAREFI